MYHLKALDPGAFRAFFEIELRTDRDAEHEKSVLPAAGDKGFEHLIRVERESRRRMDAAEVALVVVILENIVFYLCSVEHSHCICLCHDFHTPAMICIVRSCVEDILSLTEYACFSRSPHIASVRL